MQGTTEASGDFFPDRTTANRRKTSDVPLKTNHQQSRNILESGGKKNWDRWSCFMDKIKVFQVGHKQNNNLYLFFSFVFFSCEENMFHVFNFM